MLQIYVSNRRQNQPTVHGDGALLFGRDHTKSGPGFVWLNDEYVSREQFRIEKSGENRLIVTNVSPRVPLGLADGTQLLAGKSQELLLPVRLTCGETIIEIEPERAPERGSQLQTITQPVRPGSAMRAAAKLADLPETPDPATLMHWMEGVIATLRAAAGSDEFYRQSAQAVVDLVGLDVGMVIVREKGDWQVVASYPKEMKPSRAVLRDVAEQRRTFFQAEMPISEHSESLLGLSSVVASPIFDAEDEVVGVLYGARTVTGAPGRSSLRPLEAQLVQVLAAAVGAGLARQNQEEEADRNKILFEQFFCKELANVLKSDPDLLSGRDREITVMFADIRNFSRISEKLGATQSCRLVNAVMDELTAQISKQEGVLVSYLGDGLMAMWNAPAEQADQADRACRAALAMLATLPGVNAKWEESVGSPLRIGIGINTGLAIVGNNGSKIKFNYGPLGHAVNLASRVEGATKQLGVPILITGETQKRLSPSFGTRRLCRVRTVGIDQPVELYELFEENAAPDRLEARDEYEKALALFEESEFRRAIQTVYPLLAGRAEYDIPCLSLASRAVECLKSPPPKPFDSTIDLRTK